MAITKIQPIKSTLNLAISYIVNGEKTDNQILVSSYKCHPISAHIQFLKTREDNNISGTVLARHLIQSFLPNETTPEQAHKIGLELCKKILKDEYEFVLTTHIDKKHIHNHIIFNNVNMITGKCYKSNKKSYHQIRYQSDKLCKENNLSIVDEFYDIYKKKYKTKGKSWYENLQYKQGNSWKSRLQSDIDNTINISENWDDFLNKMTKLGYEIKYGKHISFKHKDKERFTRAKTIGEDYTEDKLKERIAKKENIKTYSIKECIGKVINMNNNKIKDNKVYEYWATKHNLKTMAESITFIRKNGINSINQLDEFIKKSADERQDIQDKIKDIDNEFTHLSQIMEYINIVKKYRVYYKEYKSNPNDNTFYEEYKNILILYQNAEKGIKAHYKKLPNSKDILNQIDKLQQKKDILMQEYSRTKINMNTLYQIRKNYETYMGKEIER